MYELMLSEFGDKWLVVSLLVVAGACLQGVSGVGLGMFAAPILAMIDPQLVPGPMLFLGLVIAVLSLVRERASLDSKGLGYALLGRLPASIAAALMMGFLPVRELSIVFALVILGGVLMSVVRVTLAPSPVAMFGAGCISGFMGTLTSVGLPPIALMYQNAPKATLRASIGGFLAVGSVISILALYGVGRFGLHDLVLGTWLLVPLWLGFWISGPVSRMVSAATVKWMVLGLSACAALALLARQYAV